MKEGLELVKFKLTPQMSLELIKFNELKIELNSLKKLYNLDKSDELLLKIRILENKLNNSKKRFIKDFRLNNKEEIIKYLQIRDQD